MRQPQSLLRGIRDVPDFPSPGIVFKDITPVLADAELFALAIELFRDAAAAHRPDKIAGIEARGFIFGAAVAHSLGVGFVPIRKKGKLPAATLSRSYALEYGRAEIEIHEDAFRLGERVVVIDDVLATGGTARAAIELIEQAGASVVEAQFLIELGFLHGRELLAGHSIRSFLHFESTGMV